LPEFRSRPLPFRPLPGHCFLITSLLDAIVSGLLRESLKKPQINQNTEIILDNTLKIETVSPSETVAPIYATSRRHISKDNDLHTEIIENFNLTHKHKQDMLRISRDAPKAGEGCRPAAPNRNLQKKKKKKNQIV
jgi:hypothetical protein